MSSVPEKQIYYSLGRSASFQVRLKYSMNDIFLQLIKPFKVDIAATEYGEQVIHDVVIELTDFEALNTLLLEYQRQGKLEFQERGSP